MYVDNNLLLSGAVSAAGVISGQTVAATDSSVLSTNTIDLGVARDMGEGSEFIYARSEVLTAASGGTSVEIQVIATDAANLTGNVTVVGTSGAIPVASLTLGSRWAVNINPRLASKGQRYLGVRYVTVGAVAAGAYFTDVGLEIQDGQKFYPNGFAVL
jgi:hypothetical protein